jgi:hypothetical protein
LNKSSFSFSGPEVWNSLPNEIKTGLPQVTDKLYHIKLHRVNKINKSKSLFRESNLFGLYQFSIRLSEDNT